MQADGSNESGAVRWPRGDNTRVPYHIFDDGDVHAREQARVFQGPCWQFVCLAQEVAGPGEWKNTFVGETPVVVVRDAAGGLNAFENRCVHKGALVCLADRGWAEHFTCVYHNWTYDLAGRLKSIAFRRGVKGIGGMEDSFRLEDHRLRPLRVRELCGLVFATFDDDAEELEDYIGPEILARLRRVLNRPTRILGYHSQYLANNWKLYIENVKDTYHAGLLHLFFATFKLNRLASEGGVIVSECGGNHASYSRRRTIHADAEYDSSTLRAARDDYALADPGLLDSVDEFGDGINVQILTIFPNFVLQQVENSIAVRQVLPKGTDETELLWTVLGYEDDDEAMTEMRLRQANLIGPAGYVSLEDGAVGGFVQRGVKGAADAASIIEMGGAGDASQESRVTEASVRGFWRAWRRMMGN